MKYMNNHDLDQAWRRWQLHPVLGPAIRTVANVKDMADRNSDGWCYWRAPVQACQGLIELIERDGTARYAYDEERADATAEEYKRALRAVKAFRTRMRKQWVTRGRGAFPEFDIYEPGPGIGGPVWIARLEAEDALRVYEAAKLRADAALELSRRAGRKLADAEQAEGAAKYLEFIQALREQDNSPELAHTALLARPGTRVWLLPAYDGDGYRGLGEFGTSLGLTALPGRHQRWGQALVIIRPDGGRPDEHDKRLYASVVMTVAEARERFWIVDAEGRNLVSGSHRDEMRMAQVQADKHPGCQVWAGSRFIPADPR